MIETSITKQRFGKPLRWAAFGVVALLLLSPIADAARMRSLLQEESFTDEIIDAKSLLKDVAAPEEGAVSSMESETEVDGFSAEIAGPAGGPAAASEASEGVEGKALGPSASAVRWFTSRCLGWLSTGSSEFVSRHEVVMKS
jgi:hypothetical protein